MKKKLLTVSALIIVLAILGTGTLAYFTAKTVTHNVITTGEIDIELEEMQKEGDTEVPYPTDPVGGLMPGREHSKIVRIENVGSNPAWVRIKVNVTVDDVNGDDLGSDKLSINYHILDEDKWSYIDGYYYYEEVLSPGAKTTPLFDTVVLSESMDNDYQNATISIDVNAHGIQYQNNDIPAGGDITDVWPALDLIIPLR